MSQQLAIPDGYVLVKKGGRPKSTLRDLAVFIAYQLKRSELGKGYLANDWIVANFKLNDAGHVRKCRNNAKNILTSRWVAVSLNRSAIFMFPAKMTPEGRVTAAGGTTGWGWTEGHLTALEVRLKDGFSIAGPAVDTGGKRWTLQNDDKWF